MPGIRLHLKVTAAAGADASRDTAVNIFISVNGKAFIYAIVSGVCLSLGLYALVGLVQAFILFSGERAISNAQFWGPVALVFLGSSVICAYRAYHISISRIKRRD